MPAWMSEVPWWAIATAALVLVVAAITGLRAMLARRNPRETASGLHSGYLVATVLIAAAALALIMVAFTMSYAALYESATWLADTQLTSINGGDLRFLFPLGIDAVIVYFLAMDLVMEWQGRRHPLNRWSAYGLSAITIVLNVAQGEGTTSSYLGHAGPPVVIILIAEGVAAWVRYLAGLAHGGAADRIPAGRWIAHPVSTLKVARLMLGSGITSYPDALEREQQRQLAYAMLREQYARRWRRATPRHLKWMLDNGYDLPTAFTIIRAMTASRVAMTAEEARALLGEPVNAPAGAAAPAYQAQWRAAAIPKANETPNGHRPVAGGGGGPANQDGSGEPGAPTRDGLGHTPVFQEPGPGTRWAPEPDLEDEPERAAGRSPASAGEPGADPPIQGHGSADGRGDSGTATAGGAESTVPGLRPTATGAPAVSGQATADEPKPAPQPGADYGSEPAAPPAEPAPRRSARVFARPTSRERRQRVRQLMESIPDITDEEIAGQLGVATRTARRYRNEILTTASGDGDYRLEEGEDGQPRLVDTAYGN